MNPFDELNDMVAKGFTYVPKTEEQLLATDLDNITEWASEIAGEWNGKFPGSKEDRAMQANEILDKCAELKELIEGMAGL